MVDKFPESVPDLIAALRHLRETNPKAVRSTVHRYPADVYANNGESSSTGQLRDRYITSWKMTEHMYFSANNPFPTMARGLFTEEVGNGGEVPPGLEESGLKERIVARGYDKFFNVDEMAWTNWGAMQKYSGPPYHLTLKSNGCLILISALSPTHLLVASKHSLGTTTEAEEGAQLAADMEAKLDLKDMQADPKPEKQKKKGKAKVLEEKEEDDEGPADRAHAAVGREWLAKTLKSKGQTESQLARRLWEQNLTAVLELCDDSFEEHVIATPEYWTGLHLHGLNRNTPHFSTLQPDEVTAFAHEFGFIPTKTVKLNTLDEVQSFTADIAKSGSWEGDMIEGFVVRSTVRSGISDGDQDDRPPYRAGAPFFFKIKFDEPYLLYRQMREMTKVMLPLLDKGITQEKRQEVWGKVRKKIKRAEVAVYADWVGRTVESEPELFDDFNRGIVRVRDRFLAWTEGEGKQAWTGAQAGNYKLQGGVDFAAEQKKGARKNAKQLAPRDIAALPKKYILVPIAVPGCGKTLVGLALANLYGVGHTQSDDVTTKKSAAGFLRNIAGLLKTHDVVYADRNNHIDKHYKELAALHDSPELRPFNVRLIGILWDIDRQPYHRLLRVCSERVVGRGDNHQTLRPDLTVDAEHEAVVGKFLRDFVLPDEDAFDSVIDVSIADTPVETLQKVAAGLHKSLGFNFPSQEGVQSALDAAEGYKVTTEYHPPTKLGRSIRYFGLAPEIDLAAIVEIGVYHMPPELAQSAQRFLSALQARDGVISSPHITLAHEMSVKGEKELRAASDSQNSTPGLQERAWDACVRLTEKQVTSMWEFDMTHLVWDNRAMALVVDNFQPLSKEGVEDLQHLVHEEAKEGVHITVGTKTEEIRPYEARALVELVRKKINDGEQDGEMDSPAEGGGQLRWARIGAIKGEGRIKGMW